ncbi:hypothetical protein KQX54_004601 [Cotesia glomerata]|uniref:Uncharacterized protein n=1 Tax=Cotesia glomerata TaxID=32391 RepID=A0AAV7J245_COTGL|nr:hypothetical protein KQX54_004601 [Cotesia glomerata]
MYYNESMSLNSIYTSSQLQPSVETIEKLNKTKKVKSLTHLSGSIDGLVGLWLGYDKERYIRRVDGSESHHTCDKSRKQVKAGMGTFDLEFEGMCVKVQECNEDLQVFISTDICIEVMQDVFTMGWQLEIVKMALYISFPVGLFHWFNTPGTFTESLKEVRAECAKHQDLDGKKLYDSFVDEQNKSQAMLKFQE